MLKTATRIRHFALSALVCVLCVACASAPTNPDGTPIERSPADPWEPLNRTLYESNGFLDRVTFKPMAKVYATIVPKFLRRGIRNFSFNLRAPLHIINHFLQGKFGDGIQQTGRFFINTTFGMGGFVDVATPSGIDVKIEDFGQTLAVWGVPDGPYVFIPILGPFTLRDAVVVPLNLLADPLVYYKDASVRDKVYLVRAIDFRELVLSAEAQLKDAYDPYIRLREAYLQNRRFKIYDGDPPDDEDDQDFDEFFDDEIEDELSEEQ